MTKIYNTANEKIKRRMLRKNMPKTEILLWSKLKGKSLYDHKFRRQYSIGKFVVDFYCPKIKLAIEIDGGSHFTERAETYDYERQTIIENYGIEFLRFTNREVCENVDGVLEKIAAHVRARISPAPF